MYTVYQSWFHQGIDGELNWLALYGCIVTGLSIDRVLTLMGISQDRRPRNKRVPQSVRDEVYQMRVGGMAYVDIADKLGMTVGLRKKYLQRGAKES